MRGMPLAGLRLWDRLNADRERDELGFWNKRVIIKTPKYKGKNKEKPLIFRSFCVLKENSLKVSWLNNKICLDNNPKS